MDELVGNRLVAVERLAWTQADGTTDLRVGPVHLHFELGGGLFLSGATDFTLDARLTQPGDEYWLDTYLYDVDGDRWIIRDATSEEPFGGVRGQRLTAWTSRRNEVGEQVGMDLGFETSTISLGLRGGEIGT